MPTLPADVLRRIAARVLAAAGTAEETAELVAASLIESNLRGLDSHGLVRVAQYVAEIEAGRIDPAARPVVDDRGTLIVVDGGWCFGQLAAREAARLAAERSRATGLALATVVRVQHVGRLGECVELAATAGSAALAFCNTGPAGGRVAPFGGRRALLGTNPIAYAVPADEGTIVADFSTSVVAEGRVRLARQAGEQLPEGWIVDADGKPSVDAGDLYAGGALLPAGGHKGYALGLLVEILGGLVAGAGCASLGEEPGNGLVLLVLDPGIVRPAEDFRADVARIVAAARRVPPLPGAGPVLVPGDLERESVEVRGRLGVPVPEATWRELTDVAGRLGVELALPLSPASSEASSGDTARCGDDMGPS